MPVKILLADKSITIQKVVEMLFSGKEYQVVCVSDGETALTEAGRMVPDVILADIDLPRVDGYTFSTRLKQMPALAQTPVILMMSRDDVFDQARSKQALIVDHIAKPFESQDLIGKVKKAVAGSPAQPPKPAAPGPAAAKPQMPPARPASSSAPRAAAPAKPAPADIFDIIDEAPGETDLKRNTAAVEDEAVYEVEPVIEVEEPLVPDAAKALPVGAKAVEEMREGLGLGRQQSPADPDIISFESLDMAAKSAKEYAPPKRREEERVAREWKPPVSEPPAATQPGAPGPEPHSVTADIVSRVTRETLGKMQAAGPRVSEETVRSVVEESAANMVREVAREVIEKVAWEVVPDLAAMLIREEIERLKAEP